MANAWASHGSRNTGPSASHGRSGTGRTAVRAAAGSIATLLPGILTGRLLPPRLEVARLGGTHRVSKQSHYGPPRPPDCAADLPARAAFPQRQITYRN